MTNPSLTTEPTAVNPSTVDEVLAWVEAMAERGLYQAHSARFRCTALRELVSVLGDDEPRTAQYLLDHAESLAQRWLTKKNGNPATRDAYRGKAKGALNDFFAYRAGTFKGRTRGDSAGAKKKAAAPATATAQLDLTPPPVQSQGADNGRSPAPEARSLPLGEERDPVWFALPSDWKMRDSIKLFYHTITLANDFDPTSPVTARLFSLIKAD